jgi:phospholipase C
MAFVVISSVQFPGVYLRMDGTGVTGAAATGGGTVNCQYGASAWETFHIHWVQGGMNIESVQFPGVYLRMDGSKVTAAAPSGGTVNCKYGAAGWETFTPEWQPDGTVAIASVQFPGVYLQMDGTNVTAATDTGGGTVKCHYGVGASTAFKFTGVPNQLPELVKVPNLVGSNSQQANQAAVAAGLTLQYSAIPASVCPKPGIITQQNPPAGTDALKGSAVVGIACVLSELVSVPSLMGMDYQQANQATVAAGLILQYSTTPVSVCPRPGIITRQNPAAGTQIQRGSPVAGQSCVPFTPAHPTP